MHSSKESAGTDSPPHPAAGTFAALRRVAGFTLIELMFAVAVAAILLATGVPTFRSFVLDSRLTTQANELLGGAYLARNEAVKRRATTVMCFSNDPVAAQPDCDGDGTGGWVVFVDVADLNVPAATDRNGVADAGEPVLLRRGPMPEGVTVGSLPAGNSLYVAYGASGAARTLAPAGTPYTGLVLCDSRGNAATVGGRSAARGLFQPAIGRPRITREVAEIGAALGGCP